jgi:hypothetical protein
MDEKVVMRYRGSFFVKSSDMGILAPLGDCFNSPIEFDLIIGEVHKLTYWIRSRVKLTYWSENRLLPRQKTSRSEMDHRV